MNDQPEYYVMTPGASQKFVSDMENSIALRLQQPQPPEQARRFARQIVQGQKLSLLLMQIGELLKLDKNRSVLEQIREIRERLARLEGQEH